MSRGQPVLVDAVITSEQPLEEGDIPLVRQELRIPADGPEPPLAVERTAPVAGSTRPPVILVHGFAQNRWSWRIPGRDLCAYLAQSGFEVLNLELRGHGLSRAYGAGNATRFEEYVSDLRRIVRRAQRPPFVVGHSLGGAVCIGAATEAPLQGLVHLAGVYRFARNNRTLRAICRATLLAEDALMQSRARVKTAWMGEIIARLYAITDIAGYGAPIAGWAPDSIERDLLAERLVRGFDWTSVEVWLQMSRWASGEPFAYEPAFERLDLPLLVIAGDLDPLVTPEDARLCYERSGARDKELVVFDPFEHEVHWGHVDLILGRRAPRIVWPKVLDWLLARCP